MLTSCNRYTYLTCTLPNNSSRLTDISQAGGRCVHYMVATPHGNVTSLDLSLNIRKPNWTIHNSPHEATGSTTLYSTSHSAIVFFKKMNIKNMNIIQLTFFFRIQQRHLLRAPESNVEVDTVRGGRATKLRITLDNSDCNEWFM